MASEADEYEQALALEMGYQRRQWDKLQRLEKQVVEQMARMQQLECRLEEQVDRHRNTEKQVEIYRRESQSAQTDLIEHYNEERDTRQKELHSLRASIKALDTKFDEMLSEAVREVSHSHQKVHQELRSSYDTVQRQHEELVQDVGRQCKELERLLREECTELVRGCTARCADLGREAAEERDSRQKELHGLRASINTLDGKFDGMLREAVRDLTDSHQRDQQELRSSCNAVQRQHEDLVQDLSSRCKDLERFFSEELHGSIAGVERKSLEMHSKQEELREAVRDLTDSHQRDQQQLHSSCNALQRQHEDLVQDLSSRCKDLERFFSEELHSSIAGVERKSLEMHSKHEELLTRINDVEHNLGSHTHEFTSQQIFKCSLAFTPTAGSEM